MQQVFSCCLEYTEGHLKTHLFVLPVSHYFNANVLVHFAPPLLLFYTYNRFLLFPLFPFKIWHSFWKLYHWKDGFEMFTHCYPTSFFCLHVLRCLKGLQRTLRKNNLKALGSLRISFLLQIPWYIPANLFLCFPHPCYSRESWESIHQSKVWTNFSFFIMAITVLYIYQNNNSLYKIPDI